MVTGDISVGAVGAALIAAVISVVGLILGKEQKTSEFRQAWIDALRSEIVVYLTQAAAIRDKLGVTYASHDAKVEALVPHYAGLNQASNGIKLRLNPSEPLSANVLSKMKEYEDLFSEDSKVKSDELENIEKDLLSSSQNLLKYEWRRVKRGEFAFWFSKYVAVTLSMVFTIAVIVAVVENNSEDSAKSAPQQHPQPVSARPSKGSNQIPAAIGPVDGATSPTTLHR